MIADAALESPATVATAKSADAKVTDRPDAVSAMVTARVQKERVEDLSQRTESTKVFANPDGTWTAEASNEPERVQDDAGDWHDIDTTLEQVDGGFAPKHAVGDLLLSDGGNKAFASVTSAGRTLTWKWPTTLPEPTIDGASATYKDAVAGGDLVITALPTGFRHDIVLRERPDGPVSFPIPIETGAGPDISKSTTGALTVETVGGDELATASAPVMYSLETDGESSPAPSATPSPSASASSAEPSAPTPSVGPSTTSATASDAAGPVDPADLGAPEDARPVASTLSDTATGAVQTLKPDASYLADPATTYPVVIDPSVTVYSDGDTWIGSGAPTAVHPNDDTLKMGTPDDGSNKYRAFIHFPTGTTTWYGQHVLGANMYLRNFYSKRCGTVNSPAGQMQAYRVKDDFTWSTLYWNHQPGVVTTNGSSAVTAYGASGCPANDVIVPLTGMVQDWANGAANYGVRLSAATETYTGAYREFRSAGYATTGVRPRLAVTYNSYPAVSPSSLAVSPGNTGYATTSGPTLSAVLTDKDSGALVKGQYSVLNTSGTAVWSGTTGNVATNGRASLKIPDGTLTDGATYTFKAYAHDGTDQSRAFLTSVFKVDTSAPQVTISSSAYDGSGTWLESKPVDNVFTLTSSDGDIASYAVLQDGVASTVPKNSSGATTVGWNPATGAHRLRVTPMDAAGNPGTERVFDFGVGSPGFTDPTSIVRTTEVVPLSVTGPPGATQGSLSWRMAGTTVWNTADSANVTRNGSVWNGALTSTAAGSSTGDLEWEATLESMPGSATAKLQAPALLDLRVCLGYATGTVCTKNKNIELVPSAFGGNFPVTGLGPGEVALATGELSLSASDAADTSAGVGRNFSSYGDATTRASEFGPGWTPAMTLVGSGAGGGRIIDNRAQDGTFVIELAEGGSQTFTPASSSSGRFVPLDPTGDDTNLTLNETASPQTLELSVPVGAGRQVTTWTLQQPAQAADAPAWVLRSSDPEGPDNVVTVESTQTRITWIQESDPTASSTCTQVTQTDGCRGLRLTYTGSGSSARVSSVTRVIGAESQPPTEREVAHYYYDEQATGPLTGTLTRACGAAPANGAPLCTSYGYEVTAGRVLVNRVGPAGEIPWIYSYDAAGRVVKVTRQRPSGDPTGGVAIWGIIYDMAPNASGIPDLSAASAVQWGQTDVPTSAVGITQPANNSAGSVLSQVNYMAADGGVTNTAEYGSGGWQVATQWMDERGNVIRTLDGRAWALVQQAAPADRPTLSATYSSYTRYNSWGPSGTVGNRVEDEWGPARAARLKDGRSGLYRSHTSYLYDDSPNVDSALIAGRPTPVDGSDPGLGLVVQSTTSTASLDMTSDFDQHVTRNDYRSVMSSDGSGWKLGTPVRVLDQSGPSIGTGLGAGDWSITVTRMDPAGRTIESRQPGGASATDGRGADAHSTSYEYYSNATTGDPDCHGHRAWRGLVCKVHPTVQPGTDSAAPEMPVVWTKTYNEDLLPTSTEETSSGTVVRTTSKTYDALGRKTQTAIQTFSPLVSEATTYVTDYDQLSGRAVTERVGAKVTGTDYDGWGRVAGYTDSLGTHSTNTYGADGQIATFNDSVGMYTYTYDGHGILQAVDAGGGVGTFRYNWNSLGDLQEVTFPSGMVADRGYGAGGEVNSLSYVIDDVEVLGFENAFDSDGRVVKASSAESQQLFSYDRQGRLSQVEDTRSGACTTRQYDFDDSSNRSVKRTFGPGGESQDGVPQCQSSGDSVVRSTSHDSAGRIRDLGYTYDALGRTTAVPKADTTASAQGDLAVVYAANDMVKSLSQNVLTEAGTTVSRSMSYSLDPAGRIRDIQRSGEPSWALQTRYLYGDSGDAPSVVASSTDGGTTWLTERNIVVPDLGLVATASANATALMLSNLKGDVVAAAPTAQRQGILSYGESDEFGNDLNVSPAVVGRYAWMGDRQRSREALGGQVLMGARLYSPSTGGFLSPDKVNGGNVTAYTYPQDPINASDPTGLIFQIEHQPKCTQGGGCFYMSRFCNWIHLHCSLRWDVRFQGDLRQAYRIHLYFTIAINGHEVISQPYGHDEDGRYIFHGSWGLPSERNGWTRGRYKTGFGLWKETHFLTPNSTITISIRGDVTYMGGQPGWVTGYATFKRYD